MLVLTLKWIKKHSVKAKQLIDGKALTIIDNGKINIENCKRVGLSAHERFFLSYELIMFTRRKT